MKKQSWKSRQALWVGLGLGLITLAVFSPALTHEFLRYDDQQYVTENPYVQAGMTWPGVAWAFTSTYASNWHPLTWLSHMLDWQLYGPNPAGHHLTNVLLHVANTLLLFLVLRRMTGALWRSACVAALFAWHPLHVESVAWVAERKDLLSGCFFLVTLLAYAKYAAGTQRPAATPPPPHEPGPELPLTPAPLPKERENPSVASGVVQGSKARTSSGNSHLPRPQRASSVQHPVSSIWYPASLPFYLLALAFFALGLMSKPMLVTLPFVLLLLDYWPLHRLRRSTLLRLGFEKVPFLALSALSCTVTVLAQERGNSIVPTAGLPLSLRIPHALAACLHYLEAALVPRHLAAFYPYPAAMSAAELAGVGLVLALVSLLAIRFAGRRPYLFVGWFWYLGMLVPVLGLVQVGQQAWADRYTYLPLIGWFVAVVWGVGDLALAATGERRKERPAGRAFLGGSAAVVGLALLTGTSLQLRYWRNTRTLFEHAAQVTQNNFLALTMLAGQSDFHGNPQEAETFARTALRYKPSYGLARFALGHALDRQGKIQEAISEYTAALSLEPNLEPAHMALGLLLGNQQRYDEAAAHYLAVLERHPDSAVAHNNLARLRHTQGRLDEAVEHYSAALKIDPSLAPAQNNLGVLLLQKGRLAEGVAHLEAAVRLQPDDVESQSNLATGLNQQERWQEAVDIFSRIAPGRSNDAKLQYQFGLALEHLQKTREAMSRYAQALLLLPDFPDALNRLAWILATDPRPELRNGAQAVPMAERACELTGHQQALLLLTLAATYAEVGRLEEAVATAQKAQELADTEGQRQTALKCLDLSRVLKSGKPWRESVPVSTEPGHR